jgi:phage shock protein E
VNLPLLLVTMFSIFSLSAADALVIDVRTQNEWDSGHLEGAQHIEWQDILKLTESISKDQDIYLYCQSGNRSGKATKILNDAGFIKAVNAGSIFEARDLLGLKLLE